MNMRHALLDDIQQLESLMNTAYRENHPKSWTTEHHIVRGNRINVSQLSQLLQKKGFSSICDGIGTRADHGVYWYSNKGGSCEIGHFAIHPDKQAQGFGKKLLQFAEQQAMLMEPNVEEFVMYVIDRRLELIKYYQRRGYNITDENQAYPLHLEVGQPIYELTIKQLIKRIK
ncbi:MULTISPECIES: N-acetyltransferase [unclassified Acinetobacter]|uniref:GNAT family N-acetyltransferase n=1 Tax=unclassified Acinetobacter TaxID=196816 RepID=UPI0015D36886|nr:MULTISPECIES: GNAT family N-acetyltransferase [unclassified Acinetobacter]QOW49594.1 GNAT family N-acetyltransferase [Acinetobacter sp. YH12138]